MGRRNALLSLVRHLSGATYRARVRARRAAVLDRAAREQAAEHQAARPALIAIALGRTQQLPTITPRRRLSDAPLMTPLQQARTAGGRHG